MFGFGKNEKIRILAEHGQKEANRTGKTFNLFEGEKVIMTFHPERKNNYPDFIPKTAEEQAEDLKRSSKVLENWARGRRNKEIAGKKAEGLEPCPNCQPCTTCNGKKWVQINSIDTEN